MLCFRGAEQRSSRPLGNALWGAREPTDHDLGAGLPCPRQSSWASARAKPAPSAVSLPLAPHRQRGATHAGCADSLRAARATDEGFPVVTLAPGVDESDALL